jgi:hypothetical protein
MTCIIFTLALSIKTIVSFLGPIICATSFILPSFNCQRQIMLPPWLSLWQSNTSSAQCIRPLVRCLYFLSSESFTIRILHDQAKILEGIVPGLNLCQLGVWNKTTICLQAIQPIWCFSAFANHLFLSKLSDWHEPFYTWCVCVTVVDISSLTWTDQHICRFNKQSLNESSLLQALTKSGYKCVSSPWLHATFFALSQLSYNSNSDQDCDKTHDIESDLS